MTENVSPLDVAVVGGGPAGITACLELAGRKGINVALFESEPELGGIPRSCHLFFGIRDRKRLYTGPAYARRLDALLRKTTTQIHTNATVLRVLPGPNGGLHRIVVSSPQGLKDHEARVVIIATGCYESSREARRIPGSRPSGIFTTGALQSLVNLNRLKPGARALIIGSEHVALSAILTLKRAGVSIAGMVEEDRALQTYALPAKVLANLLGFPIFGDTVVREIVGRQRVEGVELFARSQSEVLRVECDTVIVTGKFRPEISLFHDTDMELDPLTMGPLVDTNLMTSVPNIYAAGNVLRGAQMHDLCALEGKRAARGILNKWKMAEPGWEPSILMRAEHPIRFVVPQRIPVPEIRAGRRSSRLPAFSIQTALTLHGPTLEAWSGEERIWRASYSKLIGNSRIKLPVQKFDWEAVDQDKGIVLRVGYSRG